MAPSDSPKSPPQSINNQDDKWLAQLRDKLHAAGKSRFEELSQQAEAELKRKMATVPASDSTARASLFEQFMGEMRGIARMHEEEVEARVEEEKRERLWSRSLSLGISGGAASGTGANGAGVDEAMVEEQRKIWEALAYIQHGDGGDDDDAEGSDDSDGSSTEEEADGHKQLGKTTVVRKRSGTISPPRVDAHSVEQRSKSATVSPRPPNRAELTSPHSIISSLSATIPQSTLAPASQASAPSPRRRTQSTSSTRDVVAVTSITTPSQKQLTVSQMVTSPNAASQKHKVWIPPKPPHMHAAADANAKTRSSTSSRPVSLASQVSASSSTSSTNGTHSNNSTPTPLTSATSAKNGQGARAKSEDPTERKPERMHVSTSSTARQQQLQQHKLAVDTIAASSGTVSTNNSRPISRNASGSTGDANGHGHHSHQPTPAPTPMTHSQMFWTPDVTANQVSTSVNGTEDKQRTPTSHSSASSNSSRSSSRHGRSLSVSSNEGDALGAFWLPPESPDTAAVALPPSGARHPQLKPASNGLAGSAFDQATLRPTHGAPRSNVSGLEGAFGAIVSRSSSGSGSNTGAGHGLADAHDGARPLDMSIWVPGTASSANGNNAHSSNGGRASRRAPASERDAAATAHAHAQHSGPAPSQDRFYAVADHARAERLRVRRMELQTRAEVVAAYQRKMDELMREFAEALARVEDGF